MQQIIYPLLLYAVTLLCYQSTGRRMTAFCRCMALSDRYRKLYLKMLLFTVIIYHAACSFEKPLDYGLMASTAVFLPLFSMKFTHRLITALREDKRLMAMLFTICLATMFAPHLFTTSLSLAIILEAAVFWPSMSAMFFARRNIRYFNTSQYNEELITEYYR